jgi:hypothetical protein
VSDVRMDDAQSAQPSTFRLSLYGDEGGASTTGLRPTLVRGREYTLCVPVLPYTQAFARLRVFFVKPYIEHTYRWGHTHTHTHGRARSGIIFLIDD